MDFKMLNSWACLLILCTLIVLSVSLPTNLKEDAKKTDQITRTKPKRAQETLMFGNQQNRQPENRGNPYVSSAEKRALNAAGLDALKISLTKENKFPNPKSPRNSLDEREVYNPYDKNYEYGKVIVTEEGDEMPHVWDVAPYARYYIGDDRRKRSEKLIPNIRTTTIPPTSTGYHTAYQTQHSPIQTKRRYTNEEYDNEEDADPLEDEDPRNALAWMNVPAYSSYRYGTDTLSPSDIGIVHTHPSGYYDQYDNQYAQQLDNGGAHPYVNQYGTLYSQDSYYPTERKYMVAKKRAPSYDPYVNIVPLQMGIQQRGYPPYPHHMVY
ncbi:prohormone-2-like isoform X2 [Vespa velutina]|uniref:prohormone-2-like isoform X2 n=1 Tax=Vespa velutina TaxID=202808 RepID=UPI001FB23060|nr:prohormone-2-like isoform X2 [Vespa velutina]